MAAMMMRPCPPRQRGIALPVILIMLTVMLIGSIYLLRASTSTTLTVTNLAYDAALSKEADLGVHTAFDWLSQPATKPLLVANSAANGYVATMNSTWTVSTPAFWAGSVVINPVGGGSPVEYVIHRLCNFSGTYNATTPVANSCMLSAAKQGVAAPTALGSSLSQNAPVYDGQPQLHYVITARIFGPRGGNVVVQSVVMMGP
ncbi:hypothetical protein GJ698_00290 [Pseudoduganella sp. FT26W]|uniref:Pilus assembly protein PilX n=2 Tax=Duganella aquatilis TaxID=2666082 RepID=A0A844CPA3_9BURK|nr:hypothetical protein [Duganella aquatilis]